MFRLRQDDRGYEQLFVVDCEKCDLQSERPSGGCGETIIHRQEHACRTHLGRSIESPMRNHSPRHLNGNPKPGDSHGATEERNRRAIAAGANDRFLLALDRVGKHHDLTFTDEGITPFERAMERVRNGASISIVRPIPRSEYQFTLGGVSST